MKLRRWLGTFAVLVTIVGVAYVGQEVQPGGLKMAAAAQQFLASLTPEQKAKATFPFEDQERFNWHFVPLENRAKREPTRKGLRLEEMKAEQKKAALDLLRAALTDNGFQTATTIMSLEAILHELEKGSGPTRNPEWYFVSIFGEPSKSSQWGWRIEGHHLSLNFTLNNGKVTSATPLLYGANPATVMGGPRQGLRTLADIEDLPKELFKSLDDAQQQVARQQKPFPEIQAQNKLPNVSTPVGLSAAKMTDKQRGLLLKLLEAYTDRMPTEVGATELMRLKEAGIDKIHFGYNGGLERGQPHTYRIQGPTFVVEFLNAQADGAKNPANHIHSCWRSLTNDFGLAMK
jgi:hypothetical protein